MVVNSCMGSSCLTSLLSTQYKSQDVLNDSWNFISDIHWLRWYLINCTSIIIIIILLILLFIYLFIFIFFEIFLLWMIKKITYIIYGLSLQMKFNDSLNKLSSPSSSIAWHVPSHIFLELLCGARLCCEFLLFTKISRLVQVMQLTQNVRHMTRMMSPGLIFV